MSWDKSRKDFHVPYMPVWATDLLIFDEVTLWTALSPFFPVLKKNAVFLFLEPFSSKTKTSNLGSFFFFCKVDRNKVFSWNNWRVSSDVECLVSLLTGEYSCWHTHTHYTMFWQDPVQRVLWLFDRPAKNKEIKNKSVLDKSLGLVIIGVGQFRKRLILATFDFW